MSDFIKRPRLSEELCSAKDAAIACDANRTFPSGPLTATKVCDMRDDCQSPPMAFAASLLASLIASCITVCALLLGVPLFKVFLLYCVITVLASLGIILAALVFQKIAPSKR